MASSFYLVIPALCFLLLPCQSHAQKGIDWRGLANALDPSNSTLGNWLTGTNSACTLPFTGVSCDPTNSVALQLSLSDSLLQGFIPDLSVFANLTSLSLQNNMLNGQLPDTLGRLSALQSLQVGHNSLSGSLPDLASLSNLTTMDLSHNFLSNEVPAGFGNLTKLSTLLLSSNQLSGSLPLTLSNLQALTSFKVDNNPNLGGVLPAGLDYLTPADSNFTATAVQLCGALNNTQAAPSQAAPSSPPPSQLTASPEGGSKLGVAGIVGIVAGVCIGGGLLIATLVLCFCCGGAARDKKAGAAPIKPAAALADPDLEAGRKLVGPGGGGRGAGEAGRRPEMSESAVSGGAGLSGGGGVLGGSMKGEEQGTGTWSKPSEPPAMTSVQALGGSGGGGAAQGAEALMPVLRGGRRNSENSVSESIAYEAESEEDKLSDRSSNYAPSVTRHEDVPIYRSREMKAERGGGQQMLDGEEEEEELPAVVELPKGEFPTLVVIPPVRDLPRLKSLKQKKSEEAEDLPPPPPSRRARTESTATTPSAMYGAAGRALRVGDLEPVGEADYPAGDTEDESTTEGERSLQGGEGGAYAGGRVGVVGNGGGVGGEWGGSERSDISEDMSSRDVESWFSLADLALATGNFGESGARTILGTGRYGTVFKGRLADGTLVAIKRLVNDDSEQTARNFRLESDAVGRVRHPNLVPLLGCCAEGGERMLVYKYIPNGSLDSWLHGAAQSEPMDWLLRMHLAIGVARGVAHLHQGLQMKIIHRDIKSTNVLVDAQWNAKLADFALAKMMGREQSHATTRVVGTFDYVAPEYAHTGLLTERSDVYSYGVLLLEIITGLKPGKSNRTTNGMTLVEYVHSMVREERVTDVLDPRLPDVQLDDAEYVLGVALRCVETNALKRPKMSQVVNMLESEDPTLKDNWTPRRPTPLSSSRSLRDSSPPGNTLSRSSTWGQGERGGSPTHSDVGSIIATAAMKASSPRAAASAYSPRGLSPRGSSPRTGQGRERGSPGSGAGRQGLSPRTISPRGSSPTTEMGSLIANHAMTISTPKRQSAWARKS